MIEISHRDFLLTNILTVASKTASAIARRRFSWKEVQKQLYEFGNQSLGIVALCVTFMGVIIFLEYSYHVKMIISNDSLVPGFAMIMLTRELAPAVTALLLVSKMGASIAAELGAMKTTEQLDAYRLLGLSPVSLFVAPRVIAASVATLVLCFIALFTAVLGGLVACVLVLNFSPGTFTQSLLAFSKPTDFVLMSVKAVSFGASIPVIAATFGFRCRFGAEGVGLATTDAVVASSIWIIMLDFFITYGFSLFAQFAN